MNARPAPSKFLLRALLCMGIPVALTVVYAAQLVLASDTLSWGRALWQETVYWGAWWLIAIFVFRLCRWLHDGPRTGTRYTLGLLAGAVGAVILLPTIFQALRFGTSWLGDVLAIAPNTLGDFYPVWRRSLVNLIGSSFVLYTGTVLAWHAFTYARDLQERRVQSAEMESMLRQAQLQALRSQLNPHFLFNTLHSIAELMHENPPQAERMLLRLADLLRQALRSSSALEVPLEEELDFVKAYLEIEQLRLGERLTVTWDIAPDSLPARVPSLLLQPLVENAIQHGIAPSTSAGTLRISARRDGDALHLQVRDNGPGLPSTASNGASVKTDDRANSGVGLANTRSRLQRLYGERQSFELKNDQGLAVSVRLPFSTKPASSPVALTHAV